MYQPGHTDQFAHRYTYDADNRISNVETSTDLLLWNTEARYNYYKHGPLQRTVIGDGLQGMDYVYTLQGWIKSVNDPLLRKTGAMAENGITTLHDEFGFALGYNSNDYKSIGGISLNTALPFSSTSQDGSTTQSAANLYNGNITCMVTGIREFGADAVNAMNYTYDQLNRITAAQSSEYNAINQTFVKNNMYNTAYSYDKAGNILNLSRTAPAPTIPGTPPSGGSVNIDQLTYMYYNNTYNNGRNTNRLRSVYDAVAESGYESDYKQYTTNENFQYDAIGNLIQDNAEEIATISWNVSGKIVSLTRTQTSTKPDLEFEYDAMGQRIVKRVIPKNPNGTKNMAATKTTYYTRDAQGTLMATYVQTGTGELLLEEQTIYGSSRLGVYRPTTETGIVRGTRVYEGSNHLGNVLISYSDRRILTNGNTYRVDVVSASDYYPFGMSMEKRTVSEGKFGFNGKENIEEVDGWQDYGERMYNRLIGRFPTADPLIVYKQQYPELSTYQFASNRPIDGIDLDGLEYVVHYVYWDQQIKTYFKVTNYINVPKSTADNLDEKMLESFEQENKKGIPITPNEASNLCKRKNSVIPVKLPDGFNTNPNPQTTPQSNLTYNLPNIDKPAERIITPKVDIPSNATNIVYNITATVNIESGGGYNDDNVIISNNVWSASISVPGNSVNFSSSVNLPGPGTYSIRTSSNSDSHSEIIGTINVIAQATYTQPVSQTYTGRPGTAGTRQQADATPTTTDQPSLENFIQQGANDNQTLR